MEKKFQPTTGERYPQKIFAHQLITIDDLEDFKKQLLNKLFMVLKTQGGFIPKKWMKSLEVRRLLKISPGILQSLKASGTIPYYKMGGVHFYDHDDIQQILESGKINVTGKSEK